MIVNLDIAPAEHSIDWSGARLAQGLDSATTASLDGLYQALDTRLDAMTAEACNQLQVPQPDPTTTQVVGAGLAVAAATDDHLAADTLFRLCEHVTSLREEVHTTQLIMAASLAHLHRHHRRMVADREARYVG